MQKLTFEQAIDKIKHLSIYLEARRSGNDLIIIGCSDWCYNDLKQVVQCLNCKDIDLEKRGSGCATCGHGSSVIVYDILSTGT